MNTKTISLSEDSKYETVISELNRFLSKYEDCYIDSPEYKDTKKSIELFMSKSEYLSQTGTTMNIEKKISFKNSIILIVLSSSQKMSLFKKIREFIMGTK